MNSTQSRIHDLYYAFMLAEEDWWRTLVATFGKKACDIRYTQEGQTHPNCKIAYQRFKRAGESWHDLVAANRG